jgi:hypothetical protein
MTECKYIKICLVYYRYISAEDDEKLFLNKKIKAETCEKVYEGTYGNRPIFHNDSTLTCPVFQIYESYEEKLEEISKIISKEIADRTSNLESALNKTKDLLKTEK